jgi:hypothetical protein
MSNDKQKQIPAWLIPKWLKVMVGIAIAIALLLISLYLWKFSGGLAKTQDVWGQFGDYVGGILNPLFSLTALFALLHTIELQREELHKSTEQLKASAEALAMQNDVLVRQRFETTFFQMLGLFNDVVRGMERSSDTKGRSCTRALSKILQSRIPDATKENIYIQYRDNFYNDFSYLLGHYFLNLYHIIKFVDKSDLEDKDKKFYTVIIRAQLSEYELALLFYTCFCLDETQEKFLPLVKKYNMLKHLNNKLLADPAHRELLSL